jgi:hypothetical protein
MINERPIPGRPISQNIGLGSLGDPHGTTHWPPSGRICCLQLLLQSGVPNDPRPILVKEKRLDTDCRWGNYHRNHVVVSIMTRFILNCKFNFRQR